MAVELDKFFRCPNCQSYSLSKSKPNLYENIISLFVPVYVYKCSNCSYRYVDKDFDSISKRLKRTVFFVLIPIILLSILYVSGIFSKKKQEEIKKKSNTVNISQKNINKDNTNKILEKQDEIKKISENKKIITEDKKIKIEEKDSTDENDKNVVDNAINEETPDKKEVSENTSKENNYSVKDSEIKYIFFGNSKKYGVNWRTVEKGIEIVRISVNGVFYRGGIRKGDILIEIDGKNIGNGDSLNKARDDIFKGKKSDAVIKVLRDEKEMIFRLLRVRNIKVFTRSSLMTRSSHPLKKDKAYRWSFNKNSINVIRSNKQRVFLAGNFEGTENWAVDDTIIINGKSFKGIKEGIGIKGRLIDDNRKFKSLDITELIPIGKTVRLKIELVNHGILFGNTDIYIVIR